MNFGFNRFALFYIVFRDIYLVYLSFYLYIMFWRPAITYFVFLQGQQGLSKGP